MCSYKIQNSLGWGGGQILTLKNDTKLHWGRGRGQNLTLKNDPTCISAESVFMIYQKHWNRVGSNFNVEK